MPWKIPGRFFHTVEKSFPQCGKLFSVPRYPVRLGFRGLFLRGGEVGVVEAAYYSCAKVEFV